MSEQLAGMPRTWGRNPTATSRLRQSGAAFWILTILLVAFLIMQIPDLAVMLAGPGIAVGLVVLVVWLAWTLLAGWLVGLVDVYRFVPWSISLALLTWGAFVATPVAGTLENLVPPFLGEGYTTAFTAGLFEEALKLLGVVLVALIVPLLFHRPMGALICGMMAGVGFSFYENIGYTVNPMGENADTTDNLLAVLETLIIRGFQSEAAAHMVFTGLTSLGVAYLLSRTDRGLGRRWGVAITLFLAGALMHFTNDMPLTSSPVGQVFNNVLQIAVLVGLIVYAVRAERRWLPEATADAEPTIQQNEAATLRTHRSRRQARTGISDRAARERMKTMQWAQIGYVDAVADSAPEAQTEGLASFIASLRSPTGTGRIPDPRRAAPSEERLPTTESPD